MSNENNSIYTTLMKPDDLLGEDKIKKEARDLIVNYFALGEQQSLQIEEQLKAKASYSAMAASNALSGATAGVLTHIIDPAAIGASIGSAIPIVGTAAGYAVGKFISKIPGVKPIIDVFAGASAGFLIGSSVYIIHSLHSKMTSINKFKEFMSQDLDAWEMEHLKTKPLEIQHAAEILTHYLRAKATGRFSTIRLLIVPSRGNDSNFYLINAFTKMLLMLLTYMDNMTSVTIRALLQVIYDDLNIPPICDKIDKTFIDKYEEFREIVEKYIKNRIYEESIVEKIGKTLVSSLSAVSPITPWMYACVKGNENDIYFYDPEKFKELIIKDSIDSVKYRFWTDLKIVDSKEIKNSSKQSLAETEKKISKIKSIIEDLNKSNFDTRNINNIPNIDFDLSKTEKKISKLFEYAKAFIANTSNIENKKINSKNLKLIRDKTSNLIAMQYSNKEKDQYFSERTVNYLYSFFTKNHDINYKYIQKIGSINVTDKPWAKDHSKDNRTEITQEQFKNVIKNAFEIQTLFKNDIPLKNQFSKKSNSEMAVNVIKSSEKKIQTKNAIYKIITSEEKNKFLAEKYADKIDSFCELIKYSEKLVNFMFDDNKQNKFSIYSIFGLWSIFNELIKKYSVEIPQDILKFYSDKSIATQIKSSEYLNKYFILPYSSFKKILIPGFDEAYLDKNSKDFFRVFIYYFSNIINVCTEIQFHIEALKQCKFLIAMYGEQNQGLVNTKIPLLMLKENIFKIEYFMVKYKEHIDELEKEESEKRKNSYSDKIGLYNILFGEKTGFYDKFIKRFDNIKNRIKLFKDHIDETLGHIEDKIVSQNFKSRAIDEGIAKNVDPFYLETLIIYEKYLLEIQSLTRIHFKFLKFDDIEEINELNKLEIKNNIKELEEKYKEFSSTITEIPQILPIIKNREEFSLTFKRIHSFIMTLFDKKEYSLPSNIYEKSIDNNIKVLNKILTNFSQNELPQFFYRCIDLINMDEEIEITCLKIFNSYNIFDRIRNYDLTENTYIYNTMVNSVIAKKIISDKNDEIEDEKNAKEREDEEISNKKLFDESGLNNLELDEVVLPDKLSLYSTLDFYLLMICYSLANPSNIFETYTKNSTNEEKINYLYSVWGLLGISLAFCFSGIRDDAMSFLRKMNLKQNDKSIQEIERKALQNKINQEQRKALEKEKKDLEEKKKKLEEEKKLLKNQLVIYPVILHGLQSQILRLQNTTKGKKLNELVTKTDNELKKLFKTNSAEEDRKYSISLLKAVKNILLEHRNRFSFGKTQSYKDIIYIAKLYNISESDIK